jgi:hypothetical protein
MEKKNTILRIAGVLLFSGLMLLPASAAIAPIKKLTTMTTIQGDFPGNTPPILREIVWDNGGIDGYQVGLSSQLDTAYPFNSQVADDFRLNTTTGIIGVHWWGIFWNPSEGVNPTDFNIIFYADAGGMPTGAGMDDPTSTALAVYFMPQVTGIPTGEIAEYEYEVFLPGDFVANADTVYWIAIQWVGQYPPQWGWDTNGNNPEHLSSAMQGFPVAGYPYWADAGYGDMAFYLTIFCHDDTPPVTTCTITGTYEKTVTLNATDDCTGVHYTNYRIDDDPWTNYSAPFIVSEFGDHIVYFYSVDNVGNVETEKNQTFSVESPLIMTITGGFGVSVTIKNAGTIDLTNIDWTITLDGNLIFVGTAKSGTIDALAAGEEVIVKDFVVGLGKTGIVVNAEASTASASGTALLFFVIGVK